MTKQEDILPKIASGGSSRPYEFDLLKAASFISELVDRIAVLEAKLSVTPPYPVKPPQLD